MPIPQLRSDSPLLIVQVDSPQDETTGDFYYRTFAPGVGMAHCEGVYVVDLTYFHRLRHELMLDADVLVLNNICDADLLPVIRYRKARGKLTVYELCDDLEALPPTSPMRAFYRQSNNMLLIKRLAHYCDALQFSSPELEMKYGYLNSQVLRFPKSGIDNVSGKAAKIGANSDSRLGWLDRSFSRYGKDFGSPHPLDNVQGQCASLSHVRRPDLGTFRGPAGRSEETVCHGFR